MTMIVKRGHNGVGPGKVGAVPQAAETAAFDKLGPKTCAAIRDAPIKYLAFPLVSDCRRNGCDPQHPKVDEYIARAIEADCRARLSEDREPADVELGMRPLVPISKRQRA